MKEILFRAKQIDTNEWVFGYPLRGVCSTGSAWMMYISAANPDENNCTVFIDEATLGIWTGLQDENGRKIFHGDIGVLTVFDHNGYDYQYNVEAIFVMLVVFASTKFLQVIMVDGGVIGATNLISNRSLKLSETAGTTRNC